MIVSFSFKQAGTMRCCCCVVVFLIFTDHVQRIIKCTLFFEGSEGLHPFSNYSNYYRLILKQFNLIPSLEALNCEVYACQHIGNNITAIKTHKSSARNKTIIYPYKIFIETYRIDKYIEQVSCHIIKYGEIHLLKKHN